MGNGNGNGNGGSLLKAILIGLGAVALGYLVYKALGGGMYECPRCQGAVKRGSSICPHCSSNLRWG